MRIPKTYIACLVIFGALSAIAAIPNALLYLFIASIPLLGAPGFVVLAAPTILIYLLAIAPIVLARTAPNRPVAIGLVAIGLLIPVGIAIVPGLTFSVIDAVRRIRPRSLNTAISEPSTIARAAASSGWISAVALGSALSITGRFPYDVLIE